jgi:prepilin-type N-terminal cleavage/methylation domain-containing protein/prepilin-type processing-associated H-X9-DG protein
MKKQYKKAFTLIELLVVISIIALLIAILLPALGAARDSARNSECLSRMRSMAVATTAYEVENKSLLPRGHGGNNPAFQNDRDFTWYFTEYLEPYMDVEDTLDSDYYLCPDSTVEPLGSRRLSYSSFVGLFVNRDTQPTKRIKVSDIRRPTEIIGFGDAAQQSGDLVSGPNFSGGYVGPYSDKSLANEYIPFPEELNADGLTGTGLDDGYHFRYRHAGNTTANAGFIDGHAESFKINLVQQKNFARY